MISSIETWCLANSVLWRRLLYLELTRHDRDEMWLSKCQTECGGPLSVLFLVVPENISELHSMFFEVFLMFVYFWDFLYLLSTLYHQESSEKMLNALRHRVVSIFSLSNFWHICNLKSVPFKIRLVLKFDVNSEWCLQFLLVRCIGLMCI